MRKRFHHPSIILPIASAVMLLSGTLWAATDLFIVKHDAMVQGTVLYNERRGIHYSPVIYYVIDGTPYPFVPWSAQSPAAYAPGDRVDVFYNPKSPDCAKLNSFLDLWFGPLVLLIAGVIMAGVAFILRLRERSSI